ncbi:MAG: universal stress protein [Pseudomonadota bacterium]
MTIKTLHVCLTTRDDTPALLRAAVPLARQHGAHLVGVHVLDPLDIYPGASVYITPEMMSALQADRQKEADAIKDLFNAAIATEDFVSEFRMLTAGARATSTHLVESARAADLVLIAQGDRASDRRDPRHAQSAVIRQSGRPVIVVPTGFDKDSIGSRILIGWSNTREAARAAHDTLPLARPGTEVTILRVKTRVSDEMEDADLLDLSAALARHGLRVDIRHTEIAGTGIAEALLKTAFEVGADLVATGAFGHSSAYDFVVGATTSALLNSADVPVLFSK